MGGRGSYLGGFKGEGSIQETRSTPAGKMLMYLSCVTTTCFMVFLKNDKKKKSASVTTTQEDQLQHSDCPNSKAEKSAAH